MNFLIELSVSAGLVILLLTLLNPLKLLMPNSVNTMIILSLAILYLIFSSFIWKEKAKDEREQLHKNISGRFAYLLGTAVLILGVINQGLQHLIDPWLVYALSAMILGKIIGLTYSQFKY